MGWPAPTNNGPMAPAMPAVAGWGAQAPTGGQDNGWNGKGGGDWSQADGDAKQGYGQAGVANGHPPSILEACDIAGRGGTGGQTVHDIDITVKDSWDGDVAQPTVFRDFNDAQGHFPAPIFEQFQKAGFPAPSQIQAYTWPLALQGKDVIGIAATGSGKTLAFLLPAFSEMMKSGYQASRSGPALLVLAPTRELCQQTDDEASKFGTCLGMKSVSMYGGAPKRDQMSKYRCGVNVIVACPGRLNDFLEGGQVRLGSVNKLVLDEADRMLDMGFEPQIRKIMAHLSKTRQTLFFTATWPREVRKLAAEILYQPFKVMIGNRDELKGNQDIIQQVRFVDGWAKDREIMNLMKEAGIMDRNSYAKCLVFASTKRMCEQLSNMMYKAGVPCASIHGDKDQSERDKALGGLKSGHIKVLVATDVAARGLDIKGVGLVVNYDPANGTEDYVHRIGRTGRAGVKGFAVTFLNSKDGCKAKGLKEVMERTGQHIPQELQDMARQSWPSSKGGSRWGGGGGKGGGKGGGGKGGGGKGGGKGYSPY